MPETTKENRSPDEAKADSSAAINAGATKVALKLQGDGNWKVTVTTPIGAGA
jgi:hypothetical protein